MRNPEGMKPPDCDCRVGGELPRYAIKIDSAFRPQPRPVRNFASNGASKNSLKNPFYFILAAKKFIKGVYIHSEMTTLLASRIFRLTCLKLPYIIITSVILNYPMGFLLFFLLQIKVGKQYHLNNRVSILQRKETEK